MNAIATANTNSLIPTAPKGTIKIEALKIMRELGHIVIPEYQRGEVWTNAMKRAFICAIHDQEPSIGHITVHIVNMNWHIVDGQQRLSAIQEYLDDELTLPEAMVRENGLEVSFKGKYSKIPEEAKRAFLNFTLDYKVTEEPRKSFIRLQNAKPLNGAERNHALACELNEVLDALAREYQPLIEHCAFDNKRFKAEEVFMACLFMAAYGRAARAQKEYLTFYSKFDTDTNKDAVGRAKRLFAYMTESIRDKQPFLGAANFRALFLLLLDADGKLDEYKPYLNGFLKVCAANDELKMSRNRPGEEHQQKDALKGVLQLYIDTQRAFAEAEALTPESGE